MRSFPDHPIRPEGTVGKLKGVRILEMFRNPLISEPLALPPDSLKSSHTGNKAEAYISF